MKSSTAAFLRSSQHHQQPLSCQLGFVLAACRQVCVPPHTAATLVSCWIHSQTNHSSLLHVLLNAVAADGLWDDEQPQLWHRLLEGTSSPVCEVLGLQQRQWLQQELQGSRAALNVIASGSVLAGAFVCACGSSGRVRGCQGVADSRLAACMKLALRCRCVAVPLAFVELAPSRQLHVPQACMFVCTVPLCRKHRVRSWWQQHLLRRRLGVLAALTGQPAAHAGQRQRLYGGADRRLSLQRPEGH